MVDAQQSEIQVGQVAPDFRLPTQAAQFITLSEFRGRPVVIATFALAFTSG